METKITKLGLIIEMQIFPRTKTKTINTMAACLPSNFKNSVILEKQQQRKRKTKKKCVEVKITLLFSYFALVSAHKTSNP